MNWASLERRGWKLTLPNSLQVPSFFNGADTLVRLSSHLQHSKGQQDEARMANHGLVNPTLASFQTAKLFGIAEDRLYRPVAN